MDKVEGIIWLIVISTIIIGNFYLAGKHFEEMDKPKAMINLGLAVLFIILLLTKLLQIDIVNNIYNDIYI